MATTNIIGLAQPTNAIEVVNVDSEFGDQLETIVNFITSIETIERAKLGLPKSSELSAMALDLQNHQMRVELNKNIKADSGWFDAYSTIMRIIGLPPVNPGEEDGIYIADWNAITAMVSKMDIQDKKVSMAIRRGHSYGSQALRRLTELYKNERASNENGIPLSVYSIVLSKEDTILMEIRGGSNLSGGHMTMPAASLIATRQKDGRYVFDPHQGIYNKIIEEIGLDPNVHRFSVKGIIGIFDDFQCANAGLLYLTTTDHTEDELAKICRENKNAQHTGIYFIGAKGLGEYIVKNADLNPNPGLKVDPNRKLIHSAVATLMPFLDSRDSKAADRVMSRLEPVYSYQRR